MRTVTEMLWLQHRQNDLEWINLVPAGSPTVLSNHQTNVHALLQAKLQRILLTYGTSLKYPPPPANVWTCTRSGDWEQGMAHYFIMSSKAQMFRKGVRIYIYIEREIESIYIEREKESWLLSNTGMKCLGSVICGFLSINIMWAFHMHGFINNIYIMFMINYWLNLPVWNPWIQGTKYKT